jgi:hypothetical protein
MRRYFRCSLLGAVLFASTALVGVSAQQSYPGDVMDFLQTRDDCEALRNNVPEAVPGSKVDIRDTLKDIKDQCRGTDKALAALKHKYADDPSVMQKLNDYDTETERDPP